MPSETAFENQLGQIIATTWSPITLSSKLEPFTGTSPTIRYAEGGSKASFRGAAIAKENIRAGDLLLTVPTKFFPSEKRVIGGIAYLVEITTSGEMLIVDATINREELVGLDNISYWL